MPKPKPISSLVPDLKRGLANATKGAAYDITINLKENGPYWTGQFEKAWEVQTGQNGIAATLRDRSTISKSGAIELDGVEYPKPATFDLSEPFVPEPDGLKGYTIGNLMEYRDEAMDLKDGVRTNAKQKTAEDNWFVKYAKGGPMQDDLGAATYRALKAEGF